MRVSDCSMRSDRYYQERIYPPLPVRISWNVRRLDWKRWSLGLTNRGLHLLGECAQYREIEMQLEPTIFRTQTRIG